MSDDRKYWLDDRQNITKVVWGLVILCGILFVADAFYDKHPHFIAETYFGFFGIFGFVVCVGLVLTAKVMRILLKRGEDYYDD
ncbi:MAG: hypothetical protein CFH05_01440 [Alphaproteobacteria bacterium MarineAlpha3_Bin4]|nr:MAG: hypothetical protein CFH05_01440 [Alphaproteobacteria bacterium MarineAlpha3_Bin4]